MLCQNMGYAHFSSRKAFNDFIIHKEKAVGTGCDSNINCGNFIKLADYILVEQPIKQEARRRKELRPLSFNGVLSVD